MAERVFRKDIRVRRYYPAFVEACRTVCLIRSSQAQDPADDASIEISFPDFAVTALIFDEVFVESLHGKGGPTVETSQVVERLCRAEEVGPFGPKTWRKSWASPSTEPTRDCARQRLRARSGTSTRTTLNKRTRSITGLLLRGSRQIQKSYFENCMVLEGTRFDSYIRSRGSGLSIVGGQNNRASRFCSFAGFTRRITWKSCSGLKRLQNGSESHRVPYHWLSQRVRFSARCVRFHRREPRGANRAVECLHQLNIAKNRNVR